MKKVRLILYIQPWLISLDTVVLKGQELLCVASGGPLMLPWCQKRELIFIFPGIPGFDLPRNGKDTCVLYGVT